MIAILKIGMAEFAFKDSKKAAQVMALLGESEPVDHAYRKGKYIYSPIGADHLYRAELELKLVTDDCLKASVPAEDEPDEKKPMKRAVFLIGPGGAQ